MTTLIDTRMWHDCHIQDLAPCVPFNESLERAIDDVQVKYRNPLIMGICVPDENADGLFAGWMNENPQTLSRIRGIAFSFGHPAKAVQLFPSFGVVLKLPVAILQTNDRWIGTCAGHAGDMTRLLRKPSLIRTLARGVIAREIRNSRYFKGVVLDDVTASIKNADILTLEGEGHVLIYKVPPS